MVLSGMVYDIVVYNYRIKKFTSWLLRSPLTRKNPVYNFFYGRAMKNKMKKYQEIPFRVMIENTNACNYMCTFCPHKTMKRNVGFMKFSLFKKIVDDCKSLGVNYVTVYGFGEPLLDPDFIKRIEYAKSVGVERVTTNTNGSLLTSDLAEKIINAEIDEIYISVDAATESSYKKLRPHASFSNVEDNIRTLMKLRGRSGHTKPLVFLSYVESDINKNETNEFISKWKDTVDGISISKIHNWTGDIEYGKGRGVGKKDPCRLLWTEMVISWDGRVSLCCNDYENKAVLGDIRTQSIKEIWSGEKLNVIRNFHKNRKFDQINICKDCEYNYHDKSNWWVSK